MRLPSVEQPTTASVVRCGLYIASPADPRLERVEDRSNFQDQVVLATVCLRKDPGCIEAHPLLARYTDDMDARVARLRKAVETGEELWNPVAADLGDEMTWWGFPGTRPYMRAIQALGEALIGVGDQAEARACYEQLLAINPNDNQGIRYVVEELGADAAAPRM